MKTITFTKNICTCIDPQPFEDMIVLSFNKDDSILVDIIGIFEREQLMYFIYGGEYFSIPIDSYKIKRIQ